jgi:hypothetical protein
MLNTQLENYFIKRVNFLEKEKYENVDILVEFEESNKITITNEMFYNTNDPVFDRSCFYREIPEVALLYYNNVLKIIKVIYQIKLGLSFNPIDVIVDATLQFVDLSLLFFNIVPLHASAVAKSDQAVIVMGNSGAGKTTLELSLICSGFDFFADDVIFLDTNLFIYNNNENILALRKNTVILINDFFKKNYEYPLGNNKTVIDFKHLKSEHTRLWPKLLLFPKEGKSYMENYKFFELSKSALFVKLIELTISKDLPMNFKLMYLSYLRRLSETIRGIEVVRPKSVTSDLHLEMCETIKNIMYKDWVL